MAPLKEELDSDLEDTETSSQSKSKRLPEFRRANTIDYKYWKRVEDDLRLEGKQFVCASVYEVVCFQNNT